MIKTEKDLVQRLQQLQNSVQQTAKPIGSIIQSLSGDLTIAEIRACIEITLIDWNDSFEEFTQELEQIDAELSSLVSSVEAGKSVKLVSDRETV